MRVEGPLFFKGYKFLHDYHFWDIQNSPYICWLVQSSIVTLFNQVGINGKTALNIYQILTLIGMKPGFFFPISRLWIEQNIMIKNLEQIFRIKAILGIWSYWKRWNHISMRHKTKKCTKAIVEYSVMLSPNNEFKRIVINKKKKWL